VTDVTALVAVAAPHAPSRRLLPARRLGTPPPNAAIVDRIDLSPTMAVFSISPDGGVPAFVPGQYFALGLELGGRLVQRPYSAASLPRSHLLEFAIRLVPDGALTPALWRLAPGDRLRVGPPRGLFRLSDAEAGTTLLLATGTGIAPLVAMARARHGQRSPNRILIVHGVARVDELAYRAELASLAGSNPGWTYVPAVSRPADPINVAWTGHVGRLDAVVPTLTRELGVELERSAAYLCGNPAMIAGLTERLADLGVPAHAIHAEAY
jgi:ferredoxin-NADP reductase